MRPRSHDEERGERRESREGPRGKHEGAASDLIKEEREPADRGTPTRRGTFSSSARLEKREPEVIRFPNSRNR